MDLTILELNRKPKIESIELATKQQDGQTWENIGLVINELTEEDKLYLKSIDTLTPFNILDKLH